MFSRRVLVLGFQAGNEQAAETIHCGLESVAGKVVRDRPDQSILVISIIQQ
jgi:hypothetical protein